MQIPEKTVKHIAYLSRLNLTPEETKLYSGQLKDILNYIDELDRLQTEDVSPTFHVLELKNSFREDKVEKSLPAAEALRNAPEKSGDLFVVPKVF